ncbi:MAG: hypothetical protein JNN08_32225 [Bryobacterales bacterium]|nr:hypothetical protein [Bryobacterales bacterium]
MAKARLQHEINRSLEKMPEYRREFARRAIKRIMQRFYDQPEERIRPIVSVVLDALEHDEYWQVLERIDKARLEDVGALAEALRDFGLVELGMVARQAHRRLLVLDQLDALIRDPSTQERTVHTAMETNLWIFGSEFALMSSNKTLASVVEKYAGDRFGGERASQRPDLLLLSRFSERHVLLEFKRPSHKIGRPDVSQAEQYRDDLIKHVSPISVWVVGGSYDAVLLGRLTRV